MARRGRNDHLRRRLNPDHGPRYSTEVVNDSIERMSVANPYDAEFAEMMETVRRDYPDAYRREYFTIDGMTVFTYRSVGSASELDPNHLYATGPATVPAVSNVAREGIEPIQTDEIEPNITENDAQVCPEDEPTTDEGFETMEYVPLSFTNPELALAVVEEELEIVEREFEVKVEADNVVSSDSDAGPVSQIRLTSINNAIEERVDSPRMIQEIKPG